MPRRVLVAGPPVSGKSTYVRERARPGDVVLDYDQIARDLGSPDPWDHPRGIQKAAEAEMQRRLADLPPDRDAWIIRCAPGPERVSLAEQIGADVVLLDVSADEAKARAERDGRPPWTPSAIDKWWRIHNQNLPRSSGGTPTPGGQQAVPRRNKSMPEEQQNEQPNDDTGKGGGDGFKPITSQEDLNAIIGERVSRAKAQFSDYDDLKAKAARLDEIEQGDKTEADKANERISSLEKELKQSKHDALRSRVQAKFSISDDDASLFLTGDDEESLTRQAKRLAERDSDRNKQGNRAPYQGRTPDKPQNGDERETVRSLFGA